MKALMLRLGYRKDPEFDRKLVQDVKGAAKKGGAAMSNEFVRSAKAAGEKTGKELIREMQAAFRQRLGKLKLLKGVKLSDAEFKAEVRKLNRELATGLRAGMKEIQRQGRLTGDDMGRFGHAIDLAGRRAQAAGRKFKAVNRPLRSMMGSVKGLLAGFLGAAGLSRAFRFLIGDAVAFEKAMAQVWTITTATEEEIGGMSARVRELSTVLPKSAEDLGYGLYQTLSSGISDVNDAFAVLEASARLASAGLLETQASVKVVTAVINAYNLEADRAGDITDILFRTVEQGVTTVPELANSMGNVIGTAAQLGVSFDQVSAAVAALTKVLPNTEIATTSLNNLLFSVIKTGTEAEAVAKDLGIEWSLLGIQAMGFAGWIAHVTEKSGGNIDVLVKLTGSMRAARAALVLAGESSENFVATMEAMEDRTGATDRALDKTNATLAAQADLLKNRVTTRWGELSAAIGQASLKFADFVLNNEEWWARLFGWDASQVAGPETDARPAGFASARRVDEARQRQAQREAQAELDRSRAAKASAAAREREAEAARLLNLHLGALDALRGVSDQDVAIGLSEDEANRMREVVDHTRERLELERRNLAELKKIDAEIAKIEEGSEDLTIAWQEVLGAVAGVAKGLLHVLDSTGKLPDELRKVLRGVIDIAESWQQLTALRAAGNLSLSAAAGPVAAGIGAVTGIISLLVSRGQKEEQQRKEQIAAMERLRDSLDDLTESVQKDLDPGVRTQADLVGRLTQEAATADPRDRAAAREARDTAVRKLLEMLGLDEEAVFDGRALNLGRLEELLASLADVSLGVFGEDLGGRLEGLQWLFSTLGDAVGDAGEKMARFLGVLEQFSPAAADQLRKATEDSPEAVRRLLDSWSEILVAGGDPLEALLARLGLTASELQRVIGQTRGLGGDGSSGAVSQSVQLQQSITEIQAVAVVAWLQDIAFSARKMVALLSGEAALASLAGRGAMIPTKATMGVATTGAATTAPATASGVTIVNNWGPFTLDNPHITAEDMRMIFEKLAEDAIRSGAGWRGRGGIL